MCLKQRNALLRAGVRDDEARFTLDVFDDQLVRAGAELVRGRLRLLERLVPAVSAAYEMLALDARPVAAAYLSESAPEPLTAADADVGRGTAPRCARTPPAGRDRPRPDAGRTASRRAASEIDGLDARHQASQGEQRTLALALRLAGHAVVRDLAGAAPVLLLDDVFSELDAQRAARARARTCRPARRCLTTAGALPPGIDVQQTLLVRAGHVEYAP